MSRTNTDTVTDIDTVTDTVSITDTAGSQLLSKTFDTFYDDPGKSPDLQGATAPSQEPTTRS